MKQALIIGSAFIGVIVGAGFASGQEVLQYFTSFGIMGIIGAILATALFAYAGMALVWIGSRVKTTSHKEVIYQISGKVLGTIIDYVLIFTLFGVGVVMIAGAGSNLNQQFGLPVVAGTILMTLLVLMAGMLKVDRVVNIIGGITPFLILFVLLISVFSFMTADGSFAELDSQANELTTTLPNWFISAINYVSFNIAVGASMALVMGGAETNRKTAALGGLFGGLGIGILIILSNLAIFTKVEYAGQADMPMLAIVNDVSPVLGVIMSIVVFAMIFNTALSMFYSFAARFSTVETKQFKVFFTGTMVVGFIVSFFGFTKLVAYFYPLIGYLGLTLIAVLIVTPFRMKKAFKEEEKSQPQSVEQKQRATS
ncbi:YkvI family membrane protein [Thalassobacillus sp. B23F22_16]|uniref:YkvI family membrane protein n=1 Tax=Thalassobacillus sp. B23F22_16 TaxID=3459513 RepID=UPI00373FB541